MVHGSHLQRTHKHMIKHDLHVHEKQSSSRNRPTFKINGNMKATRNKTGRNRPTFKINATPPPRYEFTQSPGGHHHVKRSKQTDNISLPSKPLHHHHHTDYSMYSNHHLAYHYHDVETFSYWKTCCFKYLGVFNTTTNLISDAEQRHIALARIFRHLDHNHNGFLTFDEFLDIKEHLDQDTLKEARAVWDLEIDAEGQRAVSESVFVQRFLTSRFCSQLSLRELKFFSNEICHLKRHTTKEMKAMNIEIHTKWFRGDSHTKAHNRKILHHTIDKKTLTKSEILAQEQLRRIHSMQDHLHKGEAISTGGAIDKQLAKGKKESKRIQHIFTKQKEKKHSKYFHETGEAKDVDHESGSDDRWE